MKNEQNNNGAGRGPQDVAVGPFEPWHGRAILLVDLDAFFASVEQMDHPAWRGKPVIVGGDADKRGVVATASYEARAYGVHSAMPASTARRLCPDAIWARGRFDRYREVSQRVMGILRAESPYLQQVSIDEAFLDVTPTRHSHEHPIAIAQRIQRAVAGIGVTCSVGVGPSKSTAKVASDCDKPRGMTVVYPGRAEAFLAPLPTKAMSGIGPVAQERLRTFGITTLGEVAQADEAVLRDVFGGNADMMRARCRGADADPVVFEGEPAKSISNEISFANDLTERGDIEAAIATVAAKVCRRARLAGTKGRTATLKVRYGNLSVRTAQQPLAEPCDDEYALIPVLDRLLDNVWKPGVKVRLVGCALSKFGPESRIVQASLFEGLEEPGERGRSADGAAGRNRAASADPARVEKLASATDAVRDRFGEAAVQFGREVRTKRNLTGTGAKNPADYKRTRPRSGEG